MEISYNCTKVPESVSAEKSVYQPHLSSAGVCETGAIAAKVAAKTKDDVPAGEYRLEIRSRAGEGTNRTLVRASINGFTVKEN